MNAMHSELYVMPNCRNFVSSQQQGSTAAQEVLSIRHREVNRYSNIIASQGVPFVLSQQVCPQQCVTPSRA